MDKELLCAGFRLYKGCEIDVYFSSAICQHSGNCVCGNTELFQLNRKPWIVPDNVSKEMVITCIKNCPSGALVYRVKDKEHSGR